MAMLRIIPDVAPAVELTRVNNGSRIGPIKDASQRVIYASLAKVFCNWRIVDTMTTRCRCNGCETVWTALSIWALKTSRLSLFNVNSLLRFTTWVAAVRQKISCSLAFIILAAIDGVYSALSLEGIFSGTF